MPHQDGRGQRPLPNRQRTLVKRLGLGVATPGAVERGQVVRGSPRIGMVGADILFGDLQGLQRTTIARSYLLAW